VKVSGLDHSFPYPHQKRGDAYPVLILPMRTLPLPGGSPPARLSRRGPRAGTLLLLLAVVTLLALSPARAGYSYSGAYAWSNGAVLCVFDATLPSVTVSAADLNGTGMGVGLGQIDELASGTVVASAAIGAVAWDPVNESSAGAFVMGYAGAVPVVSAGTPSHSDGQVQVALTFSLDRVSAGGTPSDQVTSQLSIQSWPWQSAQDTLALVVPIWSAFPSTEHLVMGPASSPRVESVRNTNGQSLEYFDAGTSANRTGGFSVPVSAQTTISAGQATTTLTFGAGAGGATALTYQATLGITPNPRVLGLPWYEYAVVAGGAGLVALAVGVGARRLRRQPSDLTYAEGSG